MSRLAHIRNQRNLNAPLALAAIILVLQSHTDEEASRAAAGKKSAWRSEKDDYAQSANPAKATKWRGKTSMWINAKSEKLAKAFCDTLDATVCPVDIHTSVFGEEAGDEEAPHAEETMLDWWTRVCINAISRQEAKLPAFCNVVIVSEDTAWDFTSVVEAAKEGNTYVMETAAIPEAGGVGY